MNAALLLSLPKGVDSYVCARRGRTQTIAHISVHAERFVTPLIGAASLRSFFLNNDLGKLAEQPVLV